MHVGEMQYLIPGWTLPERVAIGTQLARTQYTEMQALPVAGDGGGALYAVLRAALYRRVG